MSITHTISQSIQIPIKIRVNEFWKGVIFFLMLDLTKKKNSHKQHTRVKRDKYKIHILI